MIQELALEMHRQLFGMALCVVWGGLGVSSRCFLALGCLQWFSGDFKSRVTGLGLAVVAVIIVWGIQPYNMYTNARTRRDSYVTM